MIHYEPSRKHIVRLFTTVCSMHCKYSGICKQWETTGQSPSFSGILIVSVRCPVPPVGSWFHLIFQEDLDVQVRSRWLSSTLDYHIMMLNIFVQGWNSCRGRFFIWSIPWTQVYFHPIHVRLKEDYSTHNNLFTNFRWTELRCIFRKHRFLYIVCFLTITRISLLPLGQMLAKFDGFLS